MPTDRYIKWQHLTGYPVKNCRRNGLFVNYYRQPYVRHLWRIWYRSQFNGCVHFIEENPLIISVSCKLPNCAPKHQMFLNKERLSATVMHTGWFNLEKTMVFSKWLEKLHVNSYCTYQFPLSLICHCTFEESPDTLWYLKPT